MTSEPLTELDLIVGRYLSDAASAEDMIRLNTEIAGNREFARSFVKECRLDTLLVEHCRKPNTASGSWLEAQFGISDGNRRDGMRWWARWIPLAVAAIALLALSGVWVAHMLRTGQSATSSPAQQLQVVAISGDVFVGATERKMVLARVGDMLTSGTFVVTGTRDSACTLQLAKKDIQIGLDGESTLIWRGLSRGLAENGWTDGGLTVELLSGKVVSSVDPIKGLKYTVRTEVGFARAVGTLFTVALTRKGTTREKGMNNPAIMVTRVARGIVLVGSLSGFTNLVHAGDTATIPAPGGVRLSPNAVISSGESQSSETNANGLENVFARQINYAKASTIKEHLEKIDTNGMLRGKMQIIADERSNQLIIITQPANMAFIDRIIDQLDIQIRLDDAAMDRERKEKTHTTIAAIGTAVDTFDATKSRLPESLDELTTETGDFPALLNKTGLNDPWGHPIQYKKISKFKYEVRSAGPDGQMGTADDLTN